MSNVARSSHNHERRIDVSDAELYRKNEQVGMGKREGYCGLTLSGRSFLLASEVILLLPPFNN